MPKKIFVATLNDQHFKRSTDREYTHAVIVQNRQPRKYVKGRTPRYSHYVPDLSYPVVITKPTSAGFCGTKELAEKLAASCRNKGWIHVTVVKVVQVK